MEDTILREGIKIVGVRFKHKGYIMHYDPGELNLHVGDYVVVETENGETLGKVISPPRYVLRVLNNQPLKRVIRVISGEELEALHKRMEEEQEAFKYCHDRIKARELPMKLLDVEYTLDEKKLIFYFSAEGRVDFRELVKDLAHKYKVRIELRQVGIRDGARMLGGYGPCGKPLCCETFLVEFEPVSIKMAREQDLIINPARISGMCGRLMCCIAFEYGVEDERG